MIPYNTPYGQLMLGIETGRVLVEEQWEDQIHVTVEYTLDQGGRTPERKLSEDPYSGKIEER